MGDEEVKKEKQKQEENDVNEPNWVLNPKKIANSRQNLSDNNRYQDTLYEIQKLKRTIRVKRKNDKHNPVPVFLTMKGIVASINSETGWIGLTFQSQYLNSLPIDGMLKWHITIFLKDGNKTEDSLKGFLQNGRFSSYPFEEKQDNSGTFISNDMPNYFDFAVITVTFERT